MYKILTAVAVVAVASLGTVIIATVLLRSSISKQSSQISGLEQAEHSDHKQIAALENQMRAASKHKKLTAAGSSCTKVPRLLGQPSLALTTPQSLTTTEQDSVMDWNGLVSVRVSSDTTAPVHCR